MKYTVETGLGGMKYCQIRGRLVKVLIYALTISNTVIVVLLAEGI
jgi:hypothetical protein